MLTTDCTVRFHTLRVALEKARTGVEGSFRTRLVIVLLAHRSATIDPGGEENEQVF